MRAVALRAALRAVTQHAVSVTLAPDDSSPANVVQSTLLVLANGAKVLRRFLQLVGGRAGQARSAVCAALVVEADLILLGDRQQVLVERRLARFTAARGFDRAVAVDQHLSKFSPSSGHAALHSSRVAKRLPFPPQPPYTKGKHRPVFASCPQEGKNPSQFPESQASVQTALADAPALPLLPDPLVPKLPATALAPARLVSPALLVLPATELAPALPFAPSMRTLPPHAPNMHIANANR